jgi:hypothetical protein
MSTPNTWFDLLKDDKSEERTTQAKLPQELVDAATTTSDIPASEWFTPKEKKKKKEAVKTPLPGEQSTLDAFSNNKPTE